MNVAETTDALLFSSSPVAEGPLISVAGKLRCVLTSNCIEIDVYL
jgi:hypothetical protein